MATGEMDDVAKKIIIIDVKYGTGDKWKDITEMAKNAVKDNRLVISCSHSDFGDPAFGEAKKIVLRYKYEGGKEQTIEQGDGVPAIVIASKRSHKSQDFTVIEALYGAGKTWLDITDKISPYIKHGKLNLANYGDGRNLAGTDPADFITKSIVVRYAHKGEEFCKSFNDGSKIVLP